MGFRVLAGCSREHRSWCTRAVACRLGCSMAHEWQRTRKVYLYDSPLMRGHCEPYVVPSILPRHQAEAGCSRQAVAGRP